MAEAAVAGLRRAGLPAEIRFLLDALAAPSGVAPRPDPGIDWPAFLACVRHHRVGLAVAPSAGMPEEARAALASHRRAAAQHVLALTAELARLTAALQAAGVDTLVLKGAALATLLGGDPLRRATRDIDLLVRPEEEAAAVAVLAGCGWSVASRHPNAVELRHPARAFPVELHVRLADDERIFPAAVLRPFETAVIVRVAGMPVRTLEAEAAVVFAAYHGAKHLWARLFWLGDIAAAARHSALDWTRATELARRTGTEAHLDTAVTLAAALLGAPRPVAVRSGGPAARRIVAAMPEVLTVPPVTDHQAWRRLGPLRSLHVELGLHRHWRARWAVLRARMMPTDTDRAVLRLPAGMDALYYAVRAARVLRTIWGRGRGR